MDEFFNVWQRGLSGENINDPFEKAFAHVLRCEGSELTNDPHDAGGKTRYGISKVYHPEVDIDSLDLPQAKTIYLNQYWIPMHCQQISDRSFGMSLIIFDCAVNPGPRATIHMMQRAMRLEDDGIIGPDTLRALETCIPEKFICDLSTQRILYYFDKVGDQPNKARYLKGWVSRSVFTAIEAMN